MTFSPDWLTFGVCIAAGCLIAAVWAGVEAWFGDEPPGPTRLP